MRLREEGIVYVLDKTILTQGPQSERWFTSRCLPYVCYRSRDNRRSYKGGDHNYSLCSPDSVCVCVCV